MHYTPYNLVRFYVGEITGTTPQTVKIYTDSSNSVDVQVNEDNKWYSYLLPKYKGLCKIEGGSVKKVVVKADISFEGISPFPVKDKHIIPSSTVEASFKSSNTSNITSMFAMFSYCSDLTSLDLSGWDTSKVTNMFAMFGYCNDLTSLDLSGWNTSKVTNMGGMFGYCNGLTSLDLRNFNTSNVTNMNGMFKGCSGLTELNLSGWVISDATNTNDMFSGCSKLSTIRMKGCSEDTINKITAVKPSGAKIVTGQTI